MATYRFPGWTKWDLSIDGTQFFVPNEHLKNTPVNAFYDQNNINKLTLK